MRLMTGAACALILSCLSVLSGATLLFTSAVAPAAAQQGDLNAILKRAKELDAAGNYPAALIEAQKLEADMKAWDLQPRHHDKCQCRAGRYWGRKPR
jgi:hypothetical protein